MCFVFRKLLCVYLFPKKDKRLPFSESWYLDFVTNENRWLRLYNARASSGCASNDALTKLSAGKQAPFARARGIVKASEL